MFFVVKAYLVGGVAKPIKFDFQAKVALEKKENELVNLNERLQSEQRMSEEEHYRLVKEIAQREDQLVELRSHVELKNLEVG